MSEPWIVAFVVLWALVLFLAILLLGVLRRVLPLLERLEAQSLAVPALGLPEGSDLPALEARNRDGEIVHADAIPRPGVVLFLEPGCQPCEQLAEQLRSNPADIEGIPLVLVAPDTVEGRSLVPVATPVMFQAGRAISRAFQTSVTPHAFLVDRDGRVSERTVPGSVADLRSLASHLGPDGTGRNPAVASP